MARKRATLTDLLNHHTARILYDKGKLLAVSAHEWEGLPDTIHTRHIENYLFDEGMCAFYHDRDHGYVCLKAQPTGKVNHHGDPLYYHILGYDGRIMRKVKAEDCVIIENNILRRNTHDFIMYYVNKLAESERTMDVNVKACKTPFIITCDDKDVLTFKRIYQQVDGNIPALFVDKNLNLDAISVLQTGVKLIANELMDYKKSVENEMYTFLGYNNTPVDKKERTNVPEVTSNNQLIESFSDMQLRAREEACEAIKAKYGLTISVKRRQEVTSNVRDNDVLNNKTDG